ncbi:MAG: class I SAM-dependent methyltransferase, partial [Acidobacteria bacterium]
RAGRVKEGRAQGLATDLPYPADSMGLVYCGLVLDDVPHESRPRVMREIHRVLRPDGYAVIMVPVLPHETIDQFRKMGFEVVLWPRHDGLEAVVLKKSGEYRDPDGPLLFERPAREGEPASEAGGAGAAGPREADPSGRPPTGTDEPGPEHDPGHR